MPKLIKDGRLVEDSWLLLKEEVCPQLLQQYSGRNVIVPLSVWLQQKELPQQHDAQVGVWLDSHELPCSIKDDLDKLPLIALHFPAFADGRPYSSARELRQNMGYKGEVRAVGDVLRDQLFYMRRCGFDAFVMREDQDLQEALDAFHDFSTGYQSSIDQPLPLFRRRA